jgi:hypothetical protein
MKDKQISLIVGVVLGGFAVLLVQWFFTYWAFRSPILIKLQTPIYRKVVIKDYVKDVKKPKILPTITPTITPTPKKQSLAPFRKYLTDKGVQTRERVLAIVSKFYIGDELIAFDNLMKKEAGYRLDAVNEIGACGIGQALPCSKMDCPLDESGLECQVNWVKSYIERRYGSPLVAWNWHIQNGWY